MLTFHGVPHEAFVALLVDWLLAAQADALDRAVLLQSEVLLCSPRTFVLMDVPAAVLANHPARTGSHAEG